LFPGEAVGNRRRNSALNRKPGKATVDESTGRSDARSFSGAAAFIVFSFGDWIVFLICTSGAEAADCGSAGIASPAAVGAPFSKRNGLPTRADKVKPWTVLPMEASYWRCSASRAAVPPSIRRNGTGRGSCSALRALSPGSILFLCGPKDIIQLSTGFYACFASGFVGFENSGTSIFNTNVSAGPVGITFKVISQMPCMRLFESLSTNRS